MKREFLVKAPTCAVAFSSVHRYLIIVTLTTLYCCNSTIYTD